LVILKGHGVVSAGTNLADAFDRMELAELSAKTVLLAAG
jgi:ribulose-5-phosphate 4-epimerase/fuculose-1-phosphate aldolase